MKLQKLGGYFCIVLVFIFVIIYVVSPIFGFKPMNQNADPVETMNRFENLSVSFRTFSQIIPIFIAAFYLVLAMALRERMKLKAPNLMNFTVVAAIIAAIGTFYGSMINGSLMEAIVQTKNVSSFNIARGIQTGIASATTHAFGWVFLLTGVAAIKAQMLPKILRYLILIYGISGTLLFAIKPLGIISMFLTIVVIIWLGIYLIRNPDPKFE